MQRTTTLRTIAQLRRRLERAELEHLNRVVADQAAHIEALEADLTEARRAADWADTRADMFHDMANALAEQSDAMIGITRAGEIGLVREPVTH